MSNITLEQACAIVDNVLDLARTKNFKPMAVAVVNADGQLIAFKRQDHKSILRSDIAIGKAWGVLSMGIGGRDLVRRANAHPHFYNALVTMSGGKIIPGVGGVLVRDAGNTIIGAVGVSGDSGDNDETCAIGGIERAGFKPDGGTA
jgi:uncharacterized protein GlcG (DUF336 family)